MYDMVKGEHRVGRFLKKRGYQFIQIGSWWSPDAGQQAGGRDLQLRLE